MMNQLSTTCEPLKLLFEEYNQGKLSSVGFRSFTLHAGENNSYQTLKSALIVPVSGQAVFSFGHEPFIVQRGMFLHGCPGKMLTISALGEQDFHYINMYYENKQRLLFSHRLKHPEQTIEILNQILKINPEAGIQEQFALEKLTEEYFSEIFSDFQPEVAYNESQMMNELLHFISEHYAEPITLDFLAERVNEKPAHISYLFYKFKKIRPIDYLINYRIKIATDLLRSGSCTVTEAAQQVGYRDACYFSRIYKKRMGFPPSRLIP